MYDSTIRTHLQRKSLAQFCSVPKSIWFQFVCEVNLPPFGIATSLFSGCLGEVQDCVPFSISCTHLLRGTNSDGSFGGYLLCQVSA